MLNFEEERYMGVAKPASGGGGGGSTPVIESLSVTPSISAQTITAPSGTDGYSPITVSAVTASIDNNIVASNIKKDVQILGVTGTYEGSGGGSSGTRYYAWQDSGGFLFMTREENPTINSTLYVYMNNIMYSLTGQASITEVVISNVNAIIIDFSGTATFTGVRNSLKDLAIFYEPQPYT